MKKTSALLALWAVPLASFAAFDDVADWADGLQVVVDIAIPLMFGIALLAFFYGVAKYIFRLGGDVNAAEEGKRIMLWGIIALFVIASVWGLVRFIRNQLEINSNGDISPPGITHTIVL